jgi:ferredoxin
MESPERRVAGLRVRVDRLLCVGFETCIEVAPDLFELDDEGIAVFRADTRGVDRDLVLSACAACPVDALEVHAPDGAKLVP